MTYAYNMKFTGFFVFGFFLVGALTIPNAFADDVIPPWIKNNAGWWADDKIDDFTFAQGIGFLIKNQIIQVQTRMIWSTQHLISCFSVLNYIAKFSRKNLISLKMDLSKMTMLL